MFANEVASLQRIAMFRELEVPKLKLIAMAGQRLHYAKGDVILRQGERARSVFVVMEGEAEVVRSTEGTDVKLAVVGPGALMGEIGVVLEQPYSATISALTKLTALQIDEATFLELLKQVPQLSMALIKELSRRVLVTSELYAKAVS